MIFRLDGGDNCWICEGWTEVIFEWSTKSGELNNVENLFLHLELDNFSPC